MPILTDKVAIVTGAARGIGRAIAEVFAANGAKVALWDVLQEELTKTANELGPSAIGQTVDITDSEQVKSSVAQVVEKFGTVHILVNNAGITRDNLLMRMRDEEWDQVLTINLKGMFVCCREVFRPMAKNQWGRIINISSVVGIMGNTGQVNYASAKAGVIGLSKSLAKELAGRKITVNVIAPGFIETSMTAGLTEEIRQTYLNRIPLNRMGTPQDIANLALFLASPQADYITGEVIAVDGGMLLNTI
jgi:3-oxoacyl-[acyl-carrier protein] reductase